MMKLKIVKMKKKDKRREKQKKQIFSDEMCNKQEIEFRLRKKHTVVDCNFQLFFFRCAAELEPYIETKYKYGSSVA